ncbi:MAG: sensor domain-containing diguanylate cyclase, partial [Gammaproteobacteria bacterium]|nr:sensor domain-containing diguanylate cyclase [Gammaproteobacteria bacterium]
DQIIPFRHKGGQTVWMRCRGFAIRDTKGNAVRMLGTHTDITAQKEAEFVLAERNKKLTAEVEALERLALYDPLTGLGNRSLFFTQLEQLIAVAARRQEEFAVLVLDLDGFKDINDRLGHSAGDKILKEFSTRLQPALRRSDQKFRVGGDEFAVLLQPLNDGFDGAKIVAEKIARVVHEPMRVKSHECEIGVSIGIAVYPGHSTEANVLFNKADAAMYEAKTHNQVCAGASESSATTVLRQLRADFADR